MGEYEKYDLIKKQAQQMPEAIANQINHHVSMTEEEYEYIVEILEELEPSFHEAGAVEAYSAFHGENQDGRDDDANSVTPSQSASQVNGNDRGKPQDTALHADDSDDGNTDDDMSKAETWLNMRKGKRNFKKKCGGKSPSRSPSRPRSGSSNPSTVSSSTPAPTGGGGYSP